MDNYEVRIFSVVTGWCAVVVVKDKRYSQQFFDVVDAASWAMNVLNDGGIKVVRIG